MYDSGMGFRCCFLAPGTFEKIGELVNKHGSSGDIQALMAELGCQNPAVWLIQAGSSPYNTSESCDEHLSELLDGEQTNTVWPIPATVRGETDRDEQPEG